MEVKSYTLTLHTPTPTPTTSSCLVQKRLQVFCTSISGHFDQGRISKSFPFSPSNLDDLFEYRQETMPPAPYNHAKG